MDDSALVSRDAALLQRAQSIAAQPSYILIFAICFLIVCAAALFIAAGGLPAIVMLAALCGLGAVAKFTKLGENLMVAIVVVVSLIVGGLALTASVMSVMGS